jgi:alkanesulfonate monooxygenase SsuD/methylene tetrahydromethanopterin reductase-like flavin-dependent oxidoreductase (luciferase family)
MREYLDGLLPLLAGQPADAVGETVTTRGSLQIPGAPTPDVYIAALGPQMLRLAGQRTAGTLTWMTGPRTLADHVGPTLREAAAEAGRQASAVRVAASLPVAVTDDVEGARARAAEEFAIYGQLPSYRAMLDREGYAGPQDAAIIGDENTVTQRLDELAKAGVDEFAAVTFDPSPEGRQRTRALLRTIDE